MKRILPCFLACAIFCLCSACTLESLLYPRRIGKSTLTQYSTIDALSQGVYDGNLSLDQLLHYGDFGLGTFNGLDGEMIVLEGTVYRIAYDGAVSVMDKRHKTPFAAVTHFSADAAINVPPGQDYAGLQQFLTRQLPSLNLCYAIRVDGLFPWVKVRSVARQNRPYPPLSEAVAQQSVFECETIQGTLVGYYVAYYGDHLNVPGFHFHFISEDRADGGHVLDLRTGACTAQLDSLCAITALMPSAAAFLQGDFHREAAMDGVEKVLLPVAF